MRFSSFCLTVTAFVACAAPVNATLIFELWRPNEQSDISCFSTSPSGTMAAGQAAFVSHYTPILNPIIMAPGSEMIVTAVLHQTDDLGPDTFFNVGNSAANSRKMLYYGFGFRYVPGVVVHKSPVDTYVDDPLIDNTNGLNRSAFFGLPLVFTNVPGASIVRDASFGAGYFTPSTYYVLASFRLQAVGSGSGNLELFDPTGMDEIGSGITHNMNQLIFSRAPGGAGTYLFPITTAVPEPTSLALMVSVAACVGYRARRYRSFAARQGTRVAS